MSIVALNTVIFTTSIVIVLIISAFIVGFILGKHLCAKDMIENYNFGDVVIDMTSPEQDLLTMELEKNPKEMLPLNYILLEVKIRR